jgi:hypothetical protein
MAIEVVVAPSTVVSTLPAIKAPMKIHIAPIIQNAIDLGSAMNMSFVFSYLNLMVFSSLVKKIEGLISTISELVVVVSIVL